MQKLLLVEQHRVGVNCIWQHKPEGITEVFKPIGWVSNPLSDDRDMNYSPMT